MNLTCRRLAHATQNLQQCAFPRTIRANNTNHFASINLKGDVIKSSIGRDRPSPGHSDQITWLIGQRVIFYKIFNEYHLFITHPGNELFIMFFDEIEKPAVCTMKAADCQTR